MAGFEPATTVLPYGAHLLYLLSYTASQSPPSESNTRPPITSRMHSPLC